MAVKRAAGLAAPPRASWRKSLVPVVCLLIAGMAAGPDTTLAQNARPKGSPMVQSVAFEALAQLRGPVYVAERNRLFQNQQELRASIQNYLQSNDWQLGMQAKILQGWASEHALYTSLNSQLDAVNVAKEEKTVAGISGVWNAYAVRARRDYQHKVLPLCWEAVTKLHADLPAWKVITFLHMIGAVPTEESIEPVVHLLEEANDAMLREAAGQALAKLPREAVKRRLGALENKHREILEAIKSTRDRF